STESSDSPGATATSTAASLHVNATRSQAALTTGQDRVVSEAASLSRRGFLGGGLTLAGGLAVARATPALAASRTRVAAIPFSPDLYASPQPQRFTVVLQQGTSNGIKYVAGPVVEVRFKGPGAGSWTPYMPMQLDRAGLPKGRGVYRAAVTFAQ